MTPVALPLVDSFGRCHDSLRISVTDRCNIRCSYCMPLGMLKFLPQRQLLSFEEIARVAEVMVRLGVRKFRLTGGEPLVRSDLAELVRMLAQLPGVEDLALTTNGMLLAEQAEGLRAAGLRRLNISLDTLDEARFVTIARREGLAEVLTGIEAALQVGFERIRLNAVALAQLTEPDVIPLVEFARRRGLEMRFIEFMPLDSEQGWAPGQVLTGAMVRQILEDEYGPLTPSERHDPAQPARDFVLPNGGQVGFINPVSEPFCGDCNRLRLSADGRLQNCLFGTEQWDLRTMLRADAAESELVACIRAAVAAKRAGHGINDPAFVRPERAMYQIGG